jgi:hypothetical protein
LNYFLVAVFDHVYALETRSSIPQSGQYNTCLEASRHLASPGVDKRGSFSSASPSEKKRARPATLPPRAFAASLQLIHIQP